MNGHRLAASLLVLGSALAGCDLSMKHQPRYATEARSDFWSDGMSARPSPEGAVAQDQTALDAAAATPPSATPALLARGREQFNIYCTPCHGPSGAGDGAVIARGSPRPPDLAEARLRASDPHHLYDVITAGYGVMYPFADKIAPADRWAVVAYMRALQTARGATS